MAQEFKGPILCKEAALAFVHVSQVVVLSLEMHMFWVQEKDVVLGN
jgi:hypothetical protein